MLWKTLLFVDNNNNIIHGVDGCRKCRFQGDSLKQLEDLLII